MKIEIGDIVQLKSGGPTMLVCTWPPAQQLDHTADELRCVWFDYTGVVRTESFEASMLRLVSKAPVDCQFGSPTWCDTHASHDCPSSAKFRIPKYDPTR